MADSKDFVAGVDSNAKKSPRRIVFITRRTSAQVKAETEEQTQTFPEVLFRAAVAMLLTTLLASTAVFLGLWLTGTELNITSMMGLTMVVGIVTEVSIFYFSEYRDLPAAEVSK